MNNNKSQTLYLTRHAEKRLKQRGITKDKLVPVILNGALYDAGSDSNAYWINRQIVKSIRKRVRDVEKLENIAVVVSSDMSILTIMRCEKPLKHWRRIA